MKELLLASLLLALVLLMAYAPLLGISLPSLESTTVSTPNDTSNFILLRAVLLSRLGDLSPTSSPTWHIMISYDIIERDLKFWRMSYIMSFINEYYHSLIMLGKQNLPYYLITTKYCIGCTTITVIFLGNHTTTTLVLRRWDLLEGYIGGTWNMDTPRITIPVVLVKRSRSPEISLLNSSVAHVTG